jgi:polar amino acid transport system substrate-binding protein
LRTKIKRILTKGLLFSILLLLNNANAKKINIVTEHLAPFQIVQENAIGGLATKIIVATLQEANIDYQITAHPWSVSYNRALKEKNTCIYSLVRIPQRTAHFQWIGHITTSSTSLYSEKESTITIENLAQAKDYKIAVIKDDVAHHYLVSTGFVENKNLYVMSNSNALLQLLEMPSRHIDMIVMNDELLNSRLDDSDDLSKYKNVFRFKDFKLDFYFACSLKTEEPIVTDLINAMKNLEQQGVFAQIKHNFQNYSERVN